MNTTAIDTSLSHRAVPSTTPKPRFLDGLAARAVEARLAGLREGRITIVEGTARR